MRKKGATPNLYGDLLLPLAGSTTLDGYLADESDGLATPEIQSARRAIWDKLRGTELTVERLQPAVFVHFGTSREYLQVVADPELAQTCGWTRHAAAWLADRNHTVSPSVLPAGGGKGVSRGGHCEGDRSTDTPSSLLLINTALEGPIELASEPVLIVDSHLCGPVTCFGAALIAGLHTALPIDLPDGLVLHQLPIDGGFVTRVYGLSDDPKRAWDDSEGTFQNWKWSEWLTDAGLRADDLWPDVPADERCLWNAALYPVGEDREESLRLVLPLLDPSKARGEAWDRWLAVPRLSLAESFVRASGERLLADLVAAEDQVACLRFLNAVESEQPAGDAKGLLGATPGVMGRRVGRVAEWLTDADPVLQLRGYEALTVASGDAFWEDRAFATLAEMIETDVRQTPSRGRDTRGRLEAATEGGGVPVEAAARIDFGGGWTDTPPYSIERGGTVLNAAVTLRGAFPIAAEATWLDERKIVLESRDVESEIEPMHAGDVLDHGNPADPFGLHKAALVLAGIVSEDCDPGLPVADVLADRGAGVRLSTQTSIPRGSGLGTSSIMAGAVLECLYRLLCREASQAQLFDDVLCLEQMLTTGGGWQDQIGGLTGGIKLLTSEPGLPQRVTIEPLQLSAKAETGLAERLVMVYTGQQRLAKNLLRSVMGRWMARDPKMVWIQQEIARLALEMRDALAAGDLDGFGGLLSEHWALNKQMDPGCTNDFIDGLFETVAPYVCGGKLAGAGGGGFAFAVAKDKDAARSLEQTLSQRYPGTPVAVWPCAIPRDVL